MVGKYSICQNPFLELRYFYLMILWNCTIDTIEMKVICFNSQLEMVQWCMLMLKLTCFVLNPLMPKTKVGKKAGNTHISQDGGKYWEFTGNTGIH